MGELTAEPCERYFGAGKAGYRLFRMPFSGFESAANSITCFTLAEFLQVFCDILTYGSN